MLFFSLWPDGGKFESYDAVWRHHADGRPKFHGIIDRLDAARYYLFDWSTVVRPA